MTTLQVQSEQLTGSVASAVDPALLSLPSPFSSAKLWLCASDIAGADGALVPTWTDRVAGRVFAPVYDAHVVKTGANGINSQNVIRQGGSAATMTHARFDGTAYTGLTVMFVIRPQANETTKGILQWYVDNANSANGFNPWVLVQRGHTVNTDVTVLVAGSYQWGISHANNAAHLYTITWNGTTWRLEVDGTDQGSPLTAGGGANQPNALALYLGYGYNGYSNTDWATLAIWNTALGTTDRANATTILKSLYGIA